jgi:CYTH domain-containing protein
MAKEVNRKFLVKAALWRAMAAERSIGRIICRRSKERVARALPDGGFLTIKGLTTGGETA